MGKRKFQDLSLSADASRPSPGCARGINNNINETEAARATVAARAGRMARPADSVVGLRPGSAKKYRRGRVAAKTFLLTYPRSTLTREDIVSGIEKLKSEIDIEWLICAKEWHKDEDGKKHDGCDWHFHVCLGYVRKKDVNVDTYFDIEGTPHPNVKIHKFNTPGDMVKYCKKEDLNPIIIGNLPEPGAVKTNVKREACRRALEEGSISGGMKIIRDEIPDEYLKYHNLYEAGLAKGLAKDPEPYITPSHYAPFIIHEEINAWVEKARKDPKERMPCLLLLGESQLGKTKFMRSLIPDHLLLGGILDIRETKKYANGPSFVILDDMEWDSISEPEMKKWACQRGERKMFDSKWFRQPVDITWATVIIDNDMPAMFRKKYWDNNLVVIDIKKRMY